MCEVMVTANGQTLTGNKYEQTYTYVRIFHYLLVDNICIYVPQLYVLHLRISLHAYILMCAYTYACE